MADLGQRFVRLAAVVREERNQIASIVEEAQGARLTFSETEPDRLALRGIGAILHDFYTGIEHLFERIAPELNGGVPAGSAWHRDLLQSMALELPGVRPPVIRAKTAVTLEEYLRFRHLFRNVYGFELDWGRILGLLDHLHEAWVAADADIERFLQFLDSASKEAGKG